MCSVGFVYNDRISHYEHTKNRIYVIRKRVDYLKWMFFQRANGYRAHYLVETWLFKNVTSKKVWIDKVSSNDND